MENARASERELARLKAKAAASAGDDLAGGAVDVKGAKVLAAALDGADVKALRETMDKLKDKLKSAAIVLASVADGKVTLIAGVTNDLTAKVKAGELVNHVAQQVGGKGGGRPDMAQAGGTDPAGLPAALQSVRALRRAAAVSGESAHQALAALNSQATITPASVPRHGRRWRRRTQATRPATAATTGPPRRRMRSAPHSKPIATSSSCSTAPPRTRSRWRDLPQYRRHRLPRDGAHQRRRMRRARVLQRRRQAPDGRHPARQAYARRRHRARCHAARRALVAAACAWR